MQDFPPTVANPGVQPSSEGGRRLRTRAFSDPDTRSPMRFLLWLLRQQPLVLIVCSLTSMAEWLPGALGPFVVGKVVDEGIVPHDLETVIRLSMVMLGLVLVGITAGTLNHTFVVRAWPGHERREDPAAEDRGRDPVPGVAEAVVDAAARQRPEPRPVVVRDVDRAAPGILDPDPG